MAINESNLIFMSKEEILSASGICQVYRDYYWAVCPERGLLFYLMRKCGSYQSDLRSASAQCNRQKETAEKILGKLYPWATLEQIPLVLQPINVSDYA